MTALASTMSPAATVGGGAHGDHADGDHADDGHARDWDMAQAELYRGFQVAYTINHNYGPAPPRLIALHSLIYFPYSLITLNDSTAVYRIFIMVCIAALNPLPRLVFGPNCIRSVIPSVPSIACHDVPPMHLMHNLHTCTLCTPTPCTLQSVCNLCAHHICTACVDPRCRGANSSGCKSIIPSLHRSKRGSTWPRRGGEAPTTPPPTTRGARRCRPSDAMRSERSGQSRRHCNQTTTSGEGEASWEACGDEEETVGEEEVS